MLVTNIPDMTAVQPVSVSPAPTPQGGSPSGGSQFSSLMNQELNDAGNNMIPEAPIEVVLPAQLGEELEKAGNMLFSMVNNSLTINMTAASAGQVCENENTEGTEESPKGSEELPKTEQSGENGLKTGAILYEIFNAFKDTNREGLPSDRANESGNDTAADETITGSRNPLASKSHLMNEHRVKGDAGGSSNGTEKQSRPELSGENGLKIGALLYEMMDTYLESDQNRSQIAPTAPCSDENGETCQTRTNIPSEHGLKAGILLSDDNTRDQQTKTGINDNKNFLAALMHNITDNAEDGDANQLNLSKHSDGKNTNQGRTVQAQANMANPDTAENNEVLNRPQHIMMPEKAKGTGNTDGSGKLQNISVRNTSTETPSESFHSLNHSNMALENSRPGDGTVAGHVARPSGFTQVLDNIVYVAKGNSKLDVSVEHSTLGKLDINLSLEKGILNVHINTSERAAREFIENNIQHIVNSLSKEGVNVGGLSVALKNRKDREDNVSAVNNGNGTEKEVIQAVEKIRTMSGAVNIFA